MKPSDAQPELQRPAWLSELFGGALGAFLGVTVLKFGNPPIMEKWVSPPTDAFEFVLGTPWPIGWGYTLLVVVAFLGLLAARGHSHAPGWLRVLPLAWFLWQCVALSQSVEPSLSQPTLLHFAACVVCFYLGCHSLSQLKNPAWFWMPLIAAFLLMLAVGWDQRFGGLEQTRHYFNTYIYPQLKEVPPDYLKKISSTRIFATLFYPNALAGAILLLLPPIAAVIWEARVRFTDGARAFLVGAVAIGALACLFWSGSKGGWLLMLVLSLLTLLRLPCGRSFRGVMLALVILGGLAGFFWNYSGFFQKGATSVVARFDYWQAALRTAAANPLVGTGPGTFSIPYKAIKRPDAEMARLVHNDYLEQATDSGIPGFLFYSAFIAGALFLAGMRVSVGVRTGLVPLGLWLGVTGWALQGLIEFGLYIPGLAWPAFTFLGWLLSQPQNLPRGQTR